MTSTLWHVCRRSCQSLYFSQILYISILFKMSQKASQADALRELVNQEIKLPAVPGCEAVTSDKAFNAAHIKWAKTDNKCGAVEFFLFDKATAAEQAEFFGYAQQCIAELQEANSKLERQNLTRSRSSNRGSSRGGCSLM